MAGDRRPLLVAQRLTHIEGFAEVIARRGSVLLAQRPGPQLVQGPPFGRPVTQRPRRLKLPT